MKTYFLDVLNGYKRLSEKLDAKRILCNKSWRIFNDSGEKEIYIFQEDGSLIISLNGKVIHATWQYIPANKSLVISTSQESFMLHPAFVDENIFALQQDGTNKFAFMIDENQTVNFAPKSLRELTCYFKEKEAKRIQEEQKQQQLHIEQQGIACKKQLEHERVQRIESLRREAEERWKIDKERILKNDKEYMAYQKRRKKDFAILILSAIPFASFSILFLAGENETIPKDKFFVEFITYFVSFLICAIIFSLGVRRVFGNFNPEESTDAKKEQYIVRHIKEKNAPKQ